MKKAIIEPIAAAIVGVLVAAVIIYGSITGVLTGGAQVNNTTVFNRSFAYTGPAREPEVILGQEVEEYVLTGFEGITKENPHYPEGEGGLSMFTEPNHMMVSYMQAINTYEVTKNVLLKLMSANYFIEREYYNSSKPFQLDSQSISLPVGTTTMIWTEDALQRFVQQSFEEKAREHGTKYRIYQNCSSNLTLEIQGEPEEPNKENNRITLQDLGFCTRPPIDMRVEGVEYEPSTNSLSARVRNRYENQSTTLYLKAVDTLGNNVTLCTKPVTYQVKYDHDETKWYDQGGEGNLRSLQYINNNGQLVSAGEGEAVNPEDVEWYGPNILTGYECGLSDYRFTPCPEGVEGRVYANIDPIKLLNDSFEPASFPNAEEVRSDIRSDINPANDNRSFKATGQNLFGNGEERTYCLENTDVSVENVVWHRGLYQPISFSIQVESRGTPKTHDVQVSLEMYNNSLAGYEASEEPIKIPCQKVMSVQQTRLSNTDYPDIQDLSEDYEPNEYRGEEYYTINTYSCVAPWDNPSWNEVLEAAAGIYDYPLSVTEGPNNYALTNPYELTDQCDNQQPSQLFRVKTSVLEYPEMGGDYNTEANPENNEYTNQSNTYCVTSPLNVGKTTSTEITSQAKPATTVSDVQNLISWDAVMDVSLYANTSKDHVITVCEDSINTQALTTREYACNHDYTWFNNGTYDANFTIHRVPDPTGEISPFEYALADNSMSVPWMIGDNIRVSNTARSSQPKTSLASTITNTGPEPTQDVTTYFTAPVSKPGAHVFEDKILYDNNEEWVDQHWEGAGSLSIEYTTEKSKQGSGSIKVTGTNSRGFVQRSFEPLTEKGGVGVWVYVPSQSGVRAMEVGAHLENEEYVRTGKHLIGKELPLDEWAYLYADVEADYKIDGITVYYFKNAEQEAAQNVEFYVGGAKLVSHEENGFYNDLKMCEDKLDFPGEWVEEDEKSTAQGKQETITCQTDYVEADVSGTITAHATPLYYESYTDDNEQASGGKRLVKNQELIAYKVKDVSNNPELQVFYNQEDINCDWAYFGSNTLKTLEAQIINEGSQDAQARVTLTIPECGTGNPYETSVPITGQANIGKGLWKARVAFCAGSSNQATQLSVEQQANENTEDNTLSKDLGTCINTERGALCTQVFSQASGEWSVSCQGVVEDTASPTLTLNTEDIQYLGQFPVDVTAVDEGNRDSKDNYLYGGPIGMNYVQYSLIPDQDACDDNVFPGDNVPHDEGNNYYTIASIPENPEETKLCVMGVDKAGNSGFQDGEVSIVSSCQGLNTQTRCEYYSTSGCEWCSQECNADNKRRNDDLILCQNPCQYECVAGECGAECSPGTLSNDCTYTARCNDAGRYQVREPNSCSSTCQCTYTTWEDDALQDSDNNAYDDRCENIDKCEENCDALGCAGRPENVPCTTQCENICGDGLTCTADADGSDYYCCDTGCVYQDACEDTGSTAYAGHYCSNGWQELKNINDACTHDYECGAGLACYDEACKKEDGQACTRGVECGSEVCVNLDNTNECQSDLSSYQFHQCSGGDYAPDQDHVVSSTSQCISKRVKTSLKDGEGNLLCEAPAVGSLDQAYSAYDDRECYEGLSLYETSLWESYTLGGVCANYDERCYDISSDPGACGTSKDDLQDCTAISHATEVECDQGVCELISCEQGYRVDGNECVELLDNGESCWYDYECSSNNCAISPNEFSQYCAAPDKECGQSGGDGYDAGSVVDHNMCQSDGSWKCEGGYYYTTKEYNYLFTGTYTESGCFQVGENYYSSSSEDNRHACPTYSSTGGSATSDSISDCKCNAGYYDENNNDDCQVSESNYYSPYYDDNEYSCPSHSTSPPGSDSISDCVCDQGYLRCGNTCRYATCYNDADCGSNERCVNDGTCDAYCACKTGFVDCGSGCQTPECDEDSDCFGLYHSCNCKINPGTTYTVCENGCCNSYECVCVRTD